MKFNNNDIKLIYNIVLRLKFSCDLLIRKKEKLNITELRKNSDPQLRLKDCYVILREILLTELLVLRQCWNNKRTYLWSEDCTQICYTTGRDLHQPTNQLIEKCLWFAGIFLPHNPCMIFFFSELTMHDFFSFLGRLQGIFFPNLPTTPPPSKVKWFAPQ